MNKDDHEAIYNQCNIDQMVEWSKTKHGGRQYDLMKAMESDHQCSSLYGLCE